jgi:hypothetical protein
MANEESAADAEPIVTIALAVTAAEMIDFEIRMVSPH